MSLSSLFNSGILKNKSGQKILDFDYIRAVTRLCGIKKVKGKYSFSQNDIVNLQSFFSQR